MKNIKEYGSLLIFLVLIILGYETIKQTFFTDYMPKNVNNSEALSDLLSNRNIKSKLAADFEDQNGGEKSPEKEVHITTRDPNLIGRWYEQKKYTSGGLNTETYLTFFEDGKIMSTNQSHGTLDVYGSDATIINEKEIDQELQSIMDQGYRWFTENGRICFSAPNGSLAGCDRTYSFDGQYLLIQLDGYKKPHAYTRSN